MKKLAVLLAFALIGGCAHIGPELPHSRDPSRQWKMDQDIAQCQYEIALAIRQPQAVSKYSVMAEYDMEQQRREMLRPCLRAKGWS